MITILIEGLPAKKARYEVLAADCDILCNPFYHLSKSCTLWE